MSASLETVAREVWKYKLDLVGVQEVRWDNGKKKGKAVPVHAMEALGVRRGIAPTHSRPRH
jgi:hypothetical protein